MTKLACWDDKFLIFFVYTRIDDLVLTFLENAKRVKNTYWKRMASANLCSNVWKHNSNSFLLLIFQSVFSLWLNQFLKLQHSANGFIIKKKKIKRKMMQSDRWLCRPVLKSHQISPHKEENWKFFHLYCSKI